MADIFRANDNIAYYFNNTFSLFSYSGLLVAYLSLKRMDKTKGKLPIPFFYLHRFLR